MSEQSEQDEARNETARSGTHNAVPVGAGINEMSLQEIFGKAVGGVIRQGRPSMNSTSSTSRSCVYRGPDGLKCAAGHVIPDEAYDRSYESCGFGVVGLRLGVDPERRYFIGRLQGAHDAKARMPLLKWREFFKAYARSLGDQYRLDLTILDTPWPE